MKCKKHGDYHSNHGCGVAVKTGTSYADHSMRCDVMKSPLYTPKYAEQGWGERIGYVSEGKYMPWEAPSGNCPDCWNQKR